MARELKIGDPAPAFSATTDDGATVSLRDFMGKKVVLFFYPKDLTSGCTTEACDFRDRNAALKKKDAVILGVSCDPVSLHAKFKAKHALNFPLLADEDHAIVTAYGVWKEKSMYGRKYMGIERTTFVIDEKGKIVAIFPKVKVAGHADEVMKIL